MSPLDSTDPSGQGESRLNGRQFGGPSVSIGLGGHRGHRLNGRQVGEPLESVDLGGEWQPAGQPATQRDLQCPSACVATGGTD